MGHGAAQLCAIDQGSDDIPARLGVAAEGIDVLVDGYPAVITRCHIGAAPDQLVEQLFMAIERGQHDRGGATNPVDIDVATRIEPAANLGEVVFFNRRQQCGIRRGKVPREVRIDPGVPGAVDVRNAHGFMIRRAPAEKQISLGKAWRPG